MRFRVHLRVLADGRWHPVVVDTQDNRRVVAVAETVRDAERVAATFERRVA